MAENKFQFGFTVNSESALAKAEKLSGIFKGGNTCFWKDEFTLTPSDAPNEGFLFADLQQYQRSGHLGHAMVEFAPGKVLAFYPNCNAQDEDFFPGHSGDGWMEYRVTEDGGDTWSDPIIDPVSRGYYEDHNHERSLNCEKAICTDDGTIVAFYLDNDLTQEVVPGAKRVWGPHGYPKCAFSKDGGKSWYGLKDAFEVRGRIYDAIYHDGKIYVLILDNPEECGNGHVDEFQYMLFVSEDDGETFYKKSVIPFQSTMHSYYGTMAFMPDGKLIVYVYEELDERNLRYCISENGGVTWNLQRRAHFSKRLRNPQLTYCDGTWFMQGRTGNYDVGNTTTCEENGHFVLYSSKDCITWDDGCVLQMRGTGAGAYSENLTVHHPDGHLRVIVQASHAYRQHRTNVHMWYLDKNKT